MFHHRNTSCGFTLIELSIVLVVIGLLVGGVLVGRDLIGAATVRAQISQIEKYQQAVNTFRGKYGYLPGDIPNPDATNFGFAMRGGFPGQGDGNGLLEGSRANAVWGAGGWFQSAGETPMLWADLSAAKLVDGSFTVANAAIQPPSDITGTALNSWYPQAKLGDSHYIFVFSNNASNYFEVEPVTRILVTTAAGIGVYSGIGMTVRQAYSIDNKIDDGFPQSGNVMAQYVSTAIVFEHYDAGPPTYPAVPIVGTSNCYDNTGPSTSAGNAGQTTAYSLGQSGAWQNFSDRRNCTLSFKFQ